jgi:tetratricopeptide (TPR) repeat protein
MAMFLCKPCLADTPGHLPAGGRESDLQLESLRQKAGKKLVLVKRLVTDSPIAGRISAGSSLEAKQLLDKAGSELEKAGELFDSGNFDGADRLLSAALSSVSSASRLVRDTHQQEMNGKQHYEQTRERVVTFSEAFDRILDEKQDPALYRLVDREKIAGMLRMAEQHARQGEYQSANSILHEAAATVEHALSMARDKETLLHELKFDSPEDEFDYEMQRNRSYELLIGMMEIKHEGSAIQHFRSAVERNRELRVEAEKLAKNGDYGQAIGMLEESTQQLARTLRMSGLAF